MSTRVRIHKNRTATLSGVHYNDLRYIVTLASNAVYDRLEEVVKPEDKAHYRSMLSLINALHKDMEVEIARVNGYTRKDLLPGQLTKTERRARLEHNRVEEALIESLVKRRRSQKTV